MNLRYQSTIVCLLMVVGYCLFSYDTTKSSGLSNSDVPDGIHSMTPKIKLVGPVQEQLTVINSSQAVTKVSFLLQLSDDVEYVDLNPRVMPIVYRNERSEIFFSELDDILVYTVITGDDDLVLEKNELIMVELNLLNINQIDMEPKLDYRYMVFPHLNEEYKIILYPENSPIVEIS